MDVLTRIWEDLISRIGGPMSLRLFLQPAMALFLAFATVSRTRARAAPPIFGRFSQIRRLGVIFCTKGGRRWSKFFVMAIVIDGIYQFIVCRWFYPGEAIITALILAFVPYLLIRGPVNRIARLWKYEAPTFERESLRK